MSETHRSTRIGRSIGAVLAGAIAGIVLSIGTDMVLRAAGILPPLGQRVADPLLLVATAYRTVYGVAGSYIAARLAPDRPMLHALVLGAIGLAANLAGTVVTWNKGPAFGPHWYPLTLIVLAMPTAWAGGRLHEMQLRTRFDG
jgi:hypothetical protein